MRILHLAMGMPEFDRAAEELGHTIERVHWRGPASRKGFDHDALSKADVLQPDLIFVQTHENLSLIHI